MQLAVAALLGPDIDLVGWRRGLVAGYLRWRRCLSACREQGPGGYHRASELIFGTDCLSVLAVREEHPKGNGCKCSTKGYIDQKGFCFHSINLSDDSDGIATDISLGLDIVFSGYAKDFEYRNPFVTIICNL